MGPPQQQRIDAWLRPVPASDDGAAVPLGGRVVALFDRHGTSAAPWAARGFACESHDPLIDDRTNRSVLGPLGVRLRYSALKSADDVRDAVGDTADVAFVIAHPPCRDLCAAGARWWKRKEKRNPQFQLRAKRFLTMVYATLTEMGVPFAILVPAGSRIQRCFPSPPFPFQPCDFGAYLPARTPHPIFDAIPAQDAYTKRTLCITSPRVRLPSRKPVAPIFFKIARRGGGTRQVSPVMASRKRTGARNCPPIGFCTALCAAAVRART